MPTQSSFFHTHVHSRYSWLDGIAGVKEIGALAVKHGHPAVSITDHGVMSAVIQLYKFCQKNDLAFFPGCEMYLVKNLDKESERYHVGLIALNYRGYKALIELNSMSFDADHFYYKPRISLKELFAFGDAHGKDVALLTGCYFGLLQQTMVEKGEMPARVVLQNYKKHFPNLFMEVQHHNGPDDTEMALWLWDMAQKFDVPPLITQDSHYCDHGDKEAHEMMKKLGYKVSDDSEVIFPGDSYHFASTGWMRNHYKDGSLRKIWDSADDSFDTLLSLNTLKLPAVDKYKFNVPEISKFPDKQLEKKARDYLKVDELKWDVYENRLKYELGIVKQMGFADYFLLFADVCQWMRHEGIFYNARGSVNGSLACYGLEITQIDPIKWDISFDRFLHPSRKKPPDIDLDIDRDRRDEVLAYVGKRCGVTPIGTFTRLTDANDRGAVFTKYLGWKRNQLGDEKFKQSPFAQIEYLRDLEKIAPKDMPALRKLAGMDILSGAGKHAAGYVLTTAKHPIEHYVPLMRVGGGGAMVTQFNDEDVEDLGYVKGDFLSLATMTTLRRALELIGKDPRHGLGWIPEDDKETFKTMRSGKTEGIFQYEGYSTMLGAKEMGVKSMDDVRICLAAYRPAAMEGGHKDEYLYYRKGRGKPVYLHHVFEKATKLTHGVFILQDQVIDVLRGVGMEYEDLNDMLKAVKASGAVEIAMAEETFKRIRPVFIRCCITSGMDTETAKKAWKKIRQFSDYGFNKAHATSYGLCAYRCAYLKTHYPKEYMGALLEVWSGTDKENRYLGEARRCGIKVARADVNKSGVRWKLDDQGNLRRGLLSIKNVGPLAAEEIVAHQPYKSVDEIIEKCSGGPGMVTGGKSWAKHKTLNGVLGALQDANAFQSLEVEDD